MSNEAPKRVLAALEEVARYPEYAHKVNWAINDFIRSELMAYGRAWEQTAGPVSERGGSPMEAGEELVGAALAPLLDKIAEVLLSVQADAQAEKETAVAAAYEDAATYWQKRGDAGKGAPYMAPSIMRQRTPDDARAALDARDKRVREDALREAAAICVAARDKRNKQRNDYPDESRDVQQRWMAGALQSQYNADAILAMIDRTAEGDT
ncbi:MAG: hypothetical protein FKY71_19740 [Spiribacter salinus]|uniref:Uncharacterized protein n=1 Tax=Spiribacter salinus TaxID=1335746 RepID=A0A540V775_9GAMM|nr:MAG: hypothetical protein FKY71_19740 [Spiribacter salinus]